MRQAGRKRTARSDLLLLNVVSATDTSQTPDVVEPPRACRAHLGIAEKSHGTLCQKRRRGSARQSTTEEL